MRGKWSKMMSKLPYKGLKRPDKAGGVVIRPGLLALPATERPEGELHRQHHAAQLGRAPRPGGGAICERKHGTPLVPQVSTKKQAACDVTTNMELLRKQKRDPSPPDGHQDRCAI